MLGESTYLALDELRLDGGPGLRLGGVGEQVHDDGAAGDGLIDIEEVLAGDPAILLSILPRLAVLSDTDDDVQAVVAKVETLTVALRTVANEGKSVVLEVVLLPVLARLPSGLVLGMLLTHQELLLGPVGTLYMRVSKQNSAQAEG